MGAWRLGRFGGAGDLGNEGFPDTLCLRCGVTDSHRPYLGPARPLKDWRTLARHHLQQATHRLRQPDPATWTRATSRVPSRGALGRCGAALWQPSSSQAERSAQSYRRGSGNSPASPIISKNWALADSRAGRNFTAFTENLSACANGSRRTLNSPLLT